MKQERDSRKGMFERLAAWLIDGQDRHFKRGENQALKASLEELHPEEEDPLRRYRIRKTAGVLKLCICAVLLCTTGTTLLLRERAIEQNRLRRPDFGQGIRAEELLAVTAESEAAIDLNLAARRLSKEEAKDMLEQALAEIDQGFLGENPSRDEVRTCLHLPDTAAAGYVQVAWNTVPYGVITSNGQIICKDEKGTLVNVQAELSCQGHVSLYQTAVRVFPPILTGKELFRHELEEALDEAQSESSTEPYLTLPSRIKAIPIRWEHREASRILLLVLLNIFAPFLYALWQDQQVREQAQTRRRELTMDYSSLVWRLALLLSAGMTIRGSVTRIVEGYEKSIRPDRHRKRAVRKRAAYEELRRTCLDMNRGIAESRSYELFGRRCVLPQYVRLGSQLSSNLRKGSKGLAQALAMEADLAMEEQKNMVRKAGETAGTRMIFPMILMMLVVLIVLMVPAFLSL